MSKQLLRCVAPFTVEYWIVATSTTDFNNQFSAILRGHTSADDAVRVAWPYDTIQYASYTLFGAAWYLSTSERGISEPVPVRGTQMKLTDIHDGVGNTCYITKGDYAGKVIDFYSNAELPYKGYLLRSDTNLIKVNSQVINFTLIAYNSTDEIEATLTFKCLAGTTWGQFVASGENTAQLETAGTTIQYPGEENYYTVTHTQGGTDSVATNNEIRATTYYCCYGW